ncbi:MAG: addiction module protein [Pseudoxanthomonas sp.]
MNAQFAQLDIESLDIEQKLDLIERLTESLALQSKNVPSPDWHGEVLAERMKRIESGEAKFCTLEELDEQLRRR